ncbi:hypothetical protein D3C71_1986240 [compost metagenome]
MSPASAANGASEISAAADSVKREEEQRLAPVWESEMLCMESSFNENGGTLATIRLTGRRDG